MFISTRGKKIARLKVLNQIRLFEVLLNIFFSHISPQTCMRLCNPIILFSYYINATPTFLLSLLFSYHSRFKLFSPYSQAQNRRSLLLSSFHNNSTGLIISSRGHQLSLKSKFFLFYCTTFYDNS